MTMATKTDKPAKLADVSNILSLFRRREYGVLALLVITLVSVGAINPAFVATGNLRDMS